MKFKEIPIDQFICNPFHKIHKEWMLITAGNRNKSNMMTASWGGFGVTWDKNVVTLYISQDRYTKEFLDANDVFTVSFLDEQLKGAMTKCGSISGRDVENKWKTSGLHPYYLENTIGVEEAQIILVCKKQYHETMRAECFDAKENVVKWFPSNACDVIYIAEILKVLKKMQINIDI